MNEVIKLRGIRVHNLKNIDLDIPLNTQIIITGVSGSGKSSLAFDTLYAEGQRRFVESLSSYARQFLERMEKPDSDLIEGITPAIAIQQKAVTKNPRSTVATVTEIHDFSRILFARIGTIHCHTCGNPVIRDTIDAIIEELLKFPPRSKILISFSRPIENGWDDLKKDGFHRIILADRVVDLDKAELTNEEFINVFVDRMLIDPKERERLVDSLELGLKKGGGRVKIQTEDHREIIFSDKLECKTCDLIYEEPVPNLFSFNSPQGACPLCHGFGDLAVVDEDKIIPDKNKSIEEGAVQPWSKGIGRHRLQRLITEAQSRKIPTDVPFKDLKEEWKRFVFRGEGRYKGVQGFFDRLQRKKYKIQVRVFIARYRKYIPCPDCHQLRLNKKALSVQINSTNIGQFVHKTVREAYDFLNNLALSSFHKQVAERLINEIKNRLKFLLEVGLEYITLDRITFTLSGGEAQRINLAAALSTSLVSTLFVLDEPSIGLHPRDNQRLIEILKSLNDIGNTVIVVEHDPEIIRSADYIIDLGPKAGRFGGEVMYAGSMDTFLKSSDTITARYMSGKEKVRVPKKRRTSKKFITITNAHKHNLKNLDVKIPLNIFTCITGVSGSGKSTLLHDVLYLGWNGERTDGYQDIKGKDLVDKIVMVDQAPISTSPRSIPATYTKAMDDIRDILSRTREARSMGFKPGYFSFNTAGGRCEECKGAGIQIVEMQFLSDVVLTCEDCKGKRYQKDILEIKFKEKNIDDILQMSIEEAYGFFAEIPKIQKKLSPLIDVGLGYVKLGQPTTTLSGGELQRIKLAYNLVHKRKEKMLYLFDEPTIGLHQDDIRVLLKTFQTLVEEGHTVVVIEHNLDMIKCADHIIDLGPEGGERGGQIVALGTPEEIVQSKTSHTARYLKSYL